MSEPGLTMQIDQRWREVSDAVGSHCVKLGRDPAACTIIAVSKTQPLEIVNRAVSAGIAHFGENRIQEAESKILAIEPRPTWHLIGHLQTNKAGRAARLFDWVHSVDSPRLAEALGRGAEAAGREVSVLVQVNSTDEPQKAGCAPQDLAEVIETVANQKLLRLCGMMTIGPLSQSERETRMAFESVAKLRDHWRQSLPASQMEVLSMGMSGDWPWALEYGADWLRIGTAIFGSRG